MNSELDIVNKLKDSMRRSCYEAFYFSDDETKLIDAEYLLTVNAAKAIMELNKYFGEPYKIRLENNTENFASACTPLFGRGRAGRHIIRTSNNTQRTGKIDIAVYTNKNGIDIPLCAIEVKGFNPSKSLVIKDLERNSEYFGLTSNTGASTLPFAVFIALHCYKGVLVDKKEQSNISKVRNRYKKYIAENKNLNIVHQGVDVFTIRRGKIPEPNDPYILEHGLQGDEDYHFVGVVITTRQSLKNKSTLTQQSCAGV